ncbi:putative cyclopropane fatty acid synthase [Fomitopsis serialis]|uniref:putative cyclopropane fatty acid synthase n=1 Tax=Fomitopsis serialis TaxID=139415 RepID=UPI0020084973|nr:putative cyclopropane fatty acid synthase [Neoantrodia serialis]KAH9934391.1 putative cyclopropane fatty acid synthase [Neoantrodia serialis]
MSHDIGLAEGYMHGDCDIDDLKGFMNLWLDNRDGLSSLETTISSLVNYYTAMAIRSMYRQNLAMARLNAAASYDVSNTFMQCFLSEEMMYSAAFWGDEENGPRGDLTVGPFPNDLESAQQRKIQSYLRQARLRPGDRLLEIGSGWGAMAIAAGKLGCIVDSITLSSEQKLLADERIAAAGLSDRVQIHLCDYRQLPPSFKGAFDACISCEMIEAVGPKNYNYYFKVIDWALKPDRGTAVISSTTQPEHRYTELQAEDFARRYHWPNNHAPSATSLVVAVQKAVNGRLVLHSVEDHGILYCRTLREWGRRFEKNFTGEALETMQDKYPYLRDPKSLEVFKRKWRYLFVYAEVGYARAYTSLHRFTFSRPENACEACA